LLRCQEFLCGRLEKGTLALQARIFINTILFVAGFSSVFILLGLLFTGALGGLGSGFTIWFSRIGGIIIILLGLQTLGIINLPFIGRSYRLNVSPRTGALSSLIFGASFGLGWTPCFGTILVAILGLAVIQGQVLIGAALLASYSFGLALPFLAVGAFTAQSARLIKKAGKYLRYIDIVAGILLIALGIIIFTGSFGRLLAFLPGTPIPEILG